jgi:hypothetical protein
MIRTPVFRKDQGSNKKLERGGDCIWRDSALSVLVSANAPSGVPLEKR